MPGNNDGGENLPERERGTSSGQSSRRNRGRRNQAPRETRFEGSCEDLKESVYDVTSGKDAFLKTTRKITECVLGRECNDAGDYRLAMINQNLPALVEPQLPADAAPPMAVELRKMARRTYDKKVEARDRNEQRIYALTLGQCSQALRNRMESHQDWSDADRSSDVMELLNVVQVCMTNRETRKHEVHSLFEAEASALSHKQGKTASNHDYYEKFKDSVATAERLGSDIGKQTTRVVAILDEVAADANAPTAAESLAAQRQAQDEHLAICFLMNSDSRRCGGLIRDIENEHTRGTNSCTVTLAGAYDYLVNYKASRLTNNDQDEGGLAFHNDDDQTGGRGYYSGRGRGGHEGRGRGRGRSGRGGRGGRGQPGANDAAGGNGNPAPEADGANADDANEPAQLLLDNTDNLDNDMNPYADGSCFQMLELANCLDGNILLVDSCSALCWLEDSDMQLEEDERKVDDVVDEKSEL